MSNPLAQIAHDLLQPLWLHVLSLAQVAQLMLVLLG